MLRVRLFQFLWPKALGKGEGCCLFGFDPSQYFSLEVNEVSCTTKGKEVESNQRSRDQTMLTPLSSLLFPFLPFLSPCEGLPDLEKKNKSRVPKYIWISNKEYLSIHLLQHWGQMAQPYSRWNLPHTIQCSCFICSWCSYAICTSIRRNCPLGRVLFGLLQDTVTIGFPTREEVKEAALNFSGMSSCFTCRTPLSF